ncbi:MAG: hypothetical protein HFJ13_11500 [Clostridium sp.]|jgi:hypothetical protein|uniref:hypothetical protein n=1 Tax=Clostridium sp. TaxID=1506 RepID=UPI0025B7C4FC|nr:hypothetical protein [Clostridium sp.]MCI9069867.1 hypothetical protein [Clostridium sp.]MCI9304716.1 hypothetical protein [Clostridium sp.]
MNYRRINGNIDLPTADEAKEEYKNVCRKLIIKEIEKANGEGKNFIFVKDMDEWLKLELKERGYKVCRIVCKSIPSLPYLPDYSEYEISWGE